MAAAWSDGSANFYTKARKPDSSAHFFTYGFRIEVELQALEWTLDRSLILTSSFNGVSFCHHHILYFKYILLHLRVGFYCVKYKFVQYYAGGYCVQSSSNKQTEKKILSSNYVFVSPHSSQHLPHVSSGPWRSRPRGWEPLVCDKSSKQKLIIGAPKLEPENAPAPEELSALIKTMGVFSSLCSSCRMFSSSSSFLTLQHRSDI